MQGGEFCSPAIHSQMTLAQESLQKLRPGVCLREVEILRVQRRNFILWKVNRDPLRVRDSITQGAVLDDIAVESDADITRCRFNCIRQTGGGEPIAEVAQIHVCVEIVVKALRLEPRDLNEV